MSENIPNWKASADELEQIRKSEEWGFLHDHRPVNEKMAFEKRVR